MQKPFIFVIKDIIIKITVNKVIVASTSMCISLHINDIRIPGYHS